MLKRMNERVSISRGIAYSIIALILGILPVRDGNAQQVEWTKTYGRVGFGSEGGQEVIRTSDGGYVIVGTTSSEMSSGWGDIYLVKTDADGNVVWDRAFGGADSDAGYSVQQTSDGGYIIAGYTRSFGEGHSNVYLIRTDENGDSIWTRAYGGQFSNHGCSVRRTSDGGYIVGGTSSASTYYDVHLMKINASGDVTWSKTYGSDTEDEYGYSVCQTLDGGYVLAGYREYFAGCIAFGRVYLVRTDPSGDTLWTRTFEDTAFVSSWSDRGYSVQQTSDGGYVIAGHAVRCSGTQVHLVKTDANGDTIYTRAFGFSGDAYGYSVQQTLDGGYVIAGYVDCEACLIKTDANGETTWTRQYRTTGSNRCYSVLQTPDSGYVLVGNISSYGPSHTDVYLIKTFADGDTVWTRTHGYAGGSDYGYSVCQTSDGGYIVTGETFSYGAGRSDVYLVKTDSEGDTIWTRSYGGQEEDEGRSVQQTFDGGYIVVGLTRSFGKGYSDVYLIRTDENGDTAWTRTYGSLIHNEEGYSVQQTSDGGYIVGGVVGYGHGDMYLIKTDSKGDTAWTRTYYSRINTYRGACSVRQTLDGGYIAVSSANSDMYLVKMNANGNIIWRNTYGGTGSDFGHSVQQTSDSGYIAVGSTSSFEVGYYDVYLVKTDVNGDTVWTRTFGTETDWEQGYSVLQTSDGGYMIAGYAGLLSPGDVYLIRTDANGDAVWTRTYGGEGDDIGRSVIETSNGGYVIAGWTDSYGPWGYDVLLMRVNGQGVEEGSNDQLATGNRQLSILPNPFIHSTVIEYHVLVKTNISLEIYDITGRLVKTLVNEANKPGKHKIRWDAKGLATGIYFAKLRVGDHESCQKIILLK